MVSSAVRRIRGARNWRSILAAVLLAISVPWIMFEIMELNAERALNRAVGREDLSELALRDSPRGWFARGYIAQSAGRLEEALTSYAGVSDTADPRFAVAIRFNLANLYLAQAVTFETGEKKPLMLSLIEQAKQNYREVLARDPGHWPSRYNLSRALEMLPDLDDVQYGNEINPERSPQAPKADTVYERLP